MIIISLEYKGIFRVSEPFDPEKISPERMAASLVFWRGKGESTHPDSWIVDTAYTVNRNHYQGSKLPYDRLLFMRNKSEAKNYNPFKEHRSAWLIEDK